MGEAVPSAEGRDLARESARLIFPTGDGLAKAQKTSFSTLSLSRPLQSREASSRGGCASQLSPMMDWDDACTSQVSRSRISSRLTAGSSLLEASDVGDLASQLS